MAVARAWNRAGAGPGAAPSPPARSPNLSSRPVVRLYGREGCGLCSQARAMLERMQGDVGFEIEDVDIEANAALHDRFFLEIPVVEIAGEVIARAPLSERILRVAIEDALER